MLKIINKILSVFHVKLVVLEKKIVPKDVVNTTHDMPAPIEYIKRIRNLCSKDVPIILPDTDFYNALILELNDPFVFIKGKASEIDATVLKACLKSLLTKKQKTSCGITWYE